MESDGNKTQAVSSMIKKWADLATTVTHLMYHSLVINGNLAKGATGREYQGSLMHHNLVINSTMRTRRTAKLVKWVKRLMFMMMGNKLWESNWRRSLKKSIKLMS